MFKYNLTDIKNRILQLENPNVEEEKQYFSALIEKTIQDPFPSWCKVTTIEYCAFFGCTNLTDITIPDSVTTIDNHAFHSCTNLTDITIPDSVTYIGSFAFHLCTNLTDMYLHPTTPPTLTHTTTISTATTTIHVPIGSGDAYRNATNWSSFADKIVEDIEI